MWGFRVHWLCATCRQIRRRSIFILVFFLVTETADMQMSEPWQWILLLSLQNYELSCVLESNEKSKIGYDIYYDFKWHIFPHRWLFHRHTSRVNLTIDSANIIYVWVSATSDTSHHFSAHCYIDFRSAASITHGDAQATQFSITHATLLIWLSHGCKLIIFPEPHSPKLPSVCAHSCKLAATRLFTDADRVERIVCEETTQSRKLKMVGAKAAAVVRLTSTKHLPHRETPIAKLCYGNITSAGNQSAAQCVCVHTWNILYIYSYLCMPDWCATQCGCLCRRRQWYFNVDARKGLNS